MKGWFDAFRDDGAPTLYSFSNRTPVTGDVSIVAVSVLFATLYIAFLVIFPGVRKQVSVIASRIDHHLPLMLMARELAFYIIYFHLNYEIPLNHFSKATSFVRKMMSDH